MNNLEQNIKDDFLYPPGTASTKEWNLNPLNAFSCILNGDLSFNSIEQKLDAIANALMNHLCLMASGHPYRIVECEMYYHDGGNHSDLYTHKRDEQLNNGTWYFNDFGLDLTFGNRQKGIYAGILIRGIQSLVNKDQYISGPSNVVREIFNQFGNVFNRESHLCFRELEGDLIEEQSPIKAKRINLPKKENDIQNYRGKPYRYLVDLCVLHKFPEKEKVLRNLILEGAITKEQAKEYMGYNINVSE